MGSYVPSNAEERREMLAKIGLSSENELYGAVPAEMKVKELTIPDGMAELTVSEKVRGMAKKNHVFGAIFRGAGAYNHYIPSIVKQVTSKEEFVTTYTPYQAEVSQGVLQNIFEYQTMICELTDMDVANASVYDGASAAAEAITMCAERKRSKMLVSAAADPMTIQTMKTYSFGSGREIELIPLKNGKTDQDALKSMLDDSVCGVFIQQPNYYGMIEDAQEIGDIVHETKAKYVMGVNPIAIAALKSPRECGADIVTGEGQSLGIPLSFGGPYVGFMACRSSMMRKLPGRLVGETVDHEGKRAYVLTLQAREQHIRREKASSNICSNENLCAMMSAVYMAAMGADGLKQCASLCYSKAHYAAEEISRIPGFELVNDGEFFHEFVTRVPDADKVLAALEEKDILGGYPVEGGLLWCVTEMNSKEQIDLLVSTLKEVASCN